MLQSSTILISPPQSISQAPCTVDCDDAPPTLRYLSLSTPFTPPSPPLSAPVAPPPTSRLCTLPNVYNNILLLFLSFFFSFSSFCSSFYSTSVFPLPLLIFLFLLPLIVPLLLLSVYLLLFFLHLPTNRRPYWIRSKAIHHDNTWIHHQLQPSPPLTPLSHPVTLSFALFVSPSYQPPLPLCLFLCLSLSLQMYLSLSGSVYLFLSVKSLFNMFGLF